jgi:hypothetical protein
VFEQKRLGDREENERMRERETRERENEREGEKERRRRSEGVTEAGVLSVFLIIGENSTYHPYQACEKEKKL